MPPRGNQPQERVCAANWRRSLCAAKRDPRLRGCTPLRTPIRRSEGAGAKRKQYYFSFLTPPPLPPLLSRVFPRTPAGGRGRPPCQRGLSPLGDWGIPTGLAWLPIPGQPPANLEGAGCRPPLPLSCTTIHGSPYGPGMPDPRLCHAARQRAEPLRPASRPPPLMGRLLSRASPAQKAPHTVKSWPSLRGLKGPDGPCVAAHQRAFTH